MWTCKAVRKGYLRFVPDLLSQISFSLFCSSIHFILTYHSPRFAPQTVSRSFPGLCSPADLPCDYLPSFHGKSRFFGLVSMSWNPVANGQEEIPEE